VYQTAAHAVGVDLTAHELAFHDRCLAVDLAGAAPDAGRTADADRIEAVVAALEAAKGRGGNCVCVVS